MCSSSTANCLPPQRRNQASSAAACSPAGRYPGRSSRAARRSPRPVPRGARRRHSNEASSYSRTWTPYAARCACLFRRPPGYGRRHARPRHHPRHRPRGQAAASTGEPSSSSTSQARLPRATASSGTTSRSRRAGRIGQPTRRLTSPSRRPPARWSMPGGPRLPGRATRTTGHPAPGPSTRPTTTAASCSTRRQQRRSRRQRARGPRRCHRPLWLRVRSLQEATRPTRRSRRRRRQQHPGRRPRQDHGGRRSRPPGSCAKPIAVRGTDPYRLDGDGDGQGCE